MKDCVANSGKTLRSQCGGKPADQKDGDHARTFIAKGRLTDRRLRREHPALRILSKYNLPQHRILDAACGTGWGTNFLAQKTKAEVLGVDVSEEAIAEAEANYKRKNLHFIRGDAETLLKLFPDQKGKFDAITMFDALPHLSNPSAFVTAVSELLSPDGNLIVSLPNGDIYPVDESGKPIYKYQHRTFNAAQLIELLKPTFRSTIYGQYLTPWGRLHRVRARETFDQLCEAYYNPMTRIGRIIKTLIGSKSSQPPHFHGSADSYPGDYAIEPIEDCPSAPITLIAICKIIAEPTDGSEDQARGS